MGRVSASDELLRAAAADLYGGDPARFIERRAELAGAARAAKEPVAAKQIAGLRKPTRGAWVVNQLIRAEPGIPGQLTELGQELRQAQRSLEGTTIRELSLRRRQLIDGLVRQAFAVAGQAAPPAALRDEVAGTLAAALADPEAADLVAEGMLARGIRSEGFGAASEPVLTLVSSSGARAKRPDAGGSPGRAGLAAVPSAGSRGSGRAAPGKAALPPAQERRLEREKAARDRSEQQRAERQRAARERAELAARRLAEAEQTLAGADQEVADAARDEQDLTAEVQRLEADLAQAQGQLAEARARGRQARSAQRQARLSVGRRQAAAGQDQDDPRRNRSR
jgi:hypothetical protein